MNFNELTFACKFPELRLETRPGCNGRKEFRILDDVRRIRTPWLVEGHAPPNTAACAVLRTDTTRLTSRHTRDADWIIVHAY